MLSTNPFGRMPPLPQSFQPGQFRLPGLPTQMPNVRSDPSSFSMGAGDAFTTPPPVSPLAAQFQPVSPMTLPGSPPMMPQIQNPMQRPQSPQGMDPQSLAMLLMGGGGMSMGMPGLLGGGILGALMGSMQKPQQQPQVLPANPGGY